MNFRRLRTQHIGGDNVTPDHSTIKDAIGALETLVSANEDQVENVCKAARKLLDALGECDIELPADVTQAMSDLEYEL